MNEKLIKSPTKLELRILRSMIYIGLFSIFQFFYFFLQPEYRGSPILYSFLCIVLCYGALRNAYLWYHYYSISVPQKPQSELRPTVDILTTYFPGEPHEMICTTLEAIQNISYPHTTYLCDEANDPFLIEQCKKLGVIHVTRNDRTDAKAGNINNALKIATGEIALILDPDHIPQPNFLDTVIPYFEDKKIGYVQVVQAYYNKVHSLVARGAAEQTFQFYGPMMMSMNSYGTVQAIGANCTFRRSALDSIGGHAPGLAEDMHTAMLLHAKGWKSVYVPALVATGMAPLDLTSYFKQQLKWSRGVFELLYTVYPKIFNRLTLRQKLHYALLPMHYLIGFIYLLNFTIPVMALFTSSMPWTGNFIKFIAISIPVLISSYCIRVFIQKWVIEKSERGFHIIGGLLQIVTWWIFILGVSYTFIRKKVPYLPTPKDEQGTNLLITLPNMAVALVSVSAIVYGLKTDITPFSLIMMVFAGINTLFMLFSLYLATRVTNKNEILRGALEREVIDYLKTVKKKFIDVSDYIFRFFRFLALPLVCLALFVSFYALIKFDKDQWENVAASKIEVHDYLYSGIFYPNDTSGLTYLPLVDSLEVNKKLHFDLVSLYIPWGDNPKGTLTPEYLEQILAKGASPIITWEPWLSNFSASDSIANSTLKGTTLNQIKNGHFDSYIEKFAMSLKVKQTVFLRFAHEFDNPTHPWYSTDENTAEDFISAWRHIHDIFATIRADNVKWIWNPWKPDDIEKYYPGDDYVDWLGVNILNGETLDRTGGWNSFENLYNPFRKSFKKICDKPIMLSEFGCLALGGDRNRWLRNSIAQITQKYDEIKGIVFYNNKFGMNFSNENAKPPSENLDYGLAEIDLGKLSIFSLKRNQETVLDKKIDTIVDVPYMNLPVPKNLRGTTYRKAENWYSNNYVANKDVLETDFELMLDAGINTIKYRHSNIYDFNIFKYSQQKGINILYSFWLPSKIDFVHDSIQLKKLKNTIIKTIKKHKYQKNIIGWNFSNDVWQELSKGYRLHALREQRHAFHLWLHGLLKEVKEIDPDRFVAKEISISQVTTVLLDDMKAYNFQIDAYSAIVDDAYWVNDFLRYVTEKNINFIIGAITIKDYFDTCEHLSNTPIILANWQNRWESHAISFDGLLDFRGFKKEAFAQTQELWADKNSDIRLPKIRILKPNITLGDKIPVTYHAVYLDKGTWNYFSEKEGRNLSWSLVKKDTYGNYLAIKSLGIGNKIRFEVPEIYQKYELALTITKNDFSKTIREDLNTHLIP